MRRYLFPLLLLLLGSPLAAFALPDTTAPTVGGITPMSVAASIPVTFSASYSDAESGVNKCQFIESGVPDLAYSDFAPNAQGTYTATITFTPGPHAVQAQCRDAAGNWGYGPVTTITAATDTVVPSVSAVSPTVATIGVPVTLAATYSDGLSGVNKCQFIESGTPDLGSSDFSPSMSGTVNVAYTFPSVGTHSVQAQCRDAAGNWGYGASTPIVVSAPDTTAPSVSSVSPVTATAGIPTTYSATYSDGVGVVECKMYDGGSLVYTSATFGPLGSGTASVALMLSSGVHSVQMKCRDGAGNWGSGTATSVTVSPASDTTPPSVGDVYPLSITASTNAVLYANASDNIGVTQCELYRNGSYYATMAYNASTGQANSIVNFSPGTYSVKARCVDAAGNVTFGTERTLTATTGSGPDTTPPSVGQIQQASAILGSSINLSALATDNVGITQCNLFVNTVDQGAMTVSGGYATRYHTFGSAGVYAVYASCRDAAGNVSNGSSRTISVSSGLLASGSLIKIACPDGAASDHPCKAVYYYGSDGKRHPFPNERVYFTWYVDFSQVMEISDVLMANTLLGKNVSYRPGIRMVKFTTVPKVYAVGRYGVLRWVTSEAIATSLYGSSWNRLIDDIPDTFYTNYTFGADITSAGSFVPASESSAVATIDANL